jgi:hypothetical protein
MVTFTIFDVAMSSNLASGYFHHAAAIGKYTLVLITQPGNSVIDNLGVKMQDLAVVDVEANCHLLAYNDPVSDTWIIQVHREPPVLQAA